MAIMTGARREKEKGKAQDNVETKSRKELKEAE